MPARNDVAVPMTAVDDDAVNDVVAGRRRGHGLPQTGAEYFASWSIFFSPAATSFGAAAGGTPRKPISVDGTSTSIFFFPSG